MNAYPGSRSGIAVAACLALLLPFLATDSGAASTPAWLAPTALVPAPDGRMLFVACYNGGRVLTVDLVSRKVVATIIVPAHPTGMALAADGKTLFVTCAAPESQVCVVDVMRARVKAKFPAGHTASAPILSPDGQTLFVCNRFDDDVSAIDLHTKSVRRIPVRREPVAATMTPDGKRLLVANLVHDGRANSDHVGAVVSVIDTAAARVVDELWLPNGSGSLNDIRISPDGKYAVVTHVLSRFHMPTTQLDRGWMNTNAKTIIALDRMEVVNTVLLDTVDRGAANPWGVAWSADSKTLVVALAGTHEVSVTDFSGLIDKLAQLSTPRAASLGAGLPYSGTASRTPSDVPNDLSFLVGLRERHRLPEGDLGPRAVVVSGRCAYTANYFSDTLSVIELDGAAPKLETIPLGPKPRMDVACQGELYFNDARICYQGWQSCASCHPSEARVDALNWDLLNDGIGNPKNNKSLLFVFQTPPAMSTGVRESAEAAVRAGIRHILFTVQPAEVGNSIDAYLQSLRPVPSPHLLKGRLSPAARRGERLFASKAVGCAQCHPRPLFTDLQSYDIGTRGRFDGESGTFDTPTLVELWRTAPYLHDGSARTLREVLIESNKDDQHGKASRLTADQINDLLEYLLSL